MKNNTGSVTKIGYIVKQDSRDKTAFVYAGTSDKNIVGVVTETSPYRTICNVANTGDALVYVAGGCLKGDMIRSRKSNDGISLGQARKLSTSDSDYFNIGIALETRQSSGLVLCSINLGSYLSSSGYLLKTGDTATGDYNFDSNTLFIDSINHRVGIGTNTPGWSFHVITDTSGIMLHRNGGTPPWDEAFIALLGNLGGGGQVRCISGANDGVKFTNYLGTTEYFRASGNGVDLNGALLVTVKSTSTTPYTILSTDFLICVDTSAGNKTINLPKATGGGRMLKIANVASSGNNAVVTPNGADTINGGGSSSVADSNCLTIIDYASGKWVIA